MTLVDRESAAGQGDCAGDCEGNRVTIIRVPERLTQRARAAVICVCYRDSRSHARALWLRKTAQQKLQATEVCCSVRCPQRSHTARVR